MKAMQKVSWLAVESVADWIDLFSEHNLEILGLDFMVDQKGKVYLIEINTNPDLTLSCSLLNRLIP